jgi:hypothetical protein
MILAELNSHIYRGMVPGSTNVVGGKSIISLRGDGGVNFAPIYILSFPTFNRKSFAALLEFLKFSKYVSHLDARSPLRSSCWNGFFAGIVTC